MRFRQRIMLREAYFHCGRFCFYTFRNDRKIEKKDKKQQNKNTNDREEQRTKTVCVCSLVCRCTRKIERKYTCKMASDWNWLRLLNHVSFAFALTTNSKSARQTTGKIFMSRSFVCPIATIKKKMKTKHETKTICKRQSFGRHEISVVTAIDERQKRIKCEEKKLVLVIAIVA